MCKVEKSETLVKIKKKKRYFTPPQHYVSLIMPDFQITKVLTELLIHICKWNRFQILNSSKMCCLLQLKICSQRPDQ